MTMKMIEIVVGRSGDTTVQTRGFTGSACQDASRFIEYALGKAVGEKLTAEFYQTAQAQSLRQAENEANR